MGPGTAKESAAPLSAPSTSQMAAHDTNSGSGPVLVIALGWMGCGTDQAPLAPGDTQTVGPLSKPAGRGLGAVMAVQNRHTPDLMRIPGVVGTATGLEADGNARILVLAKTPGVAGIPRNLDGVPVIVKVTGEIRALKPNPDKKPPRPTPEPEPDVDPTARFDRPVPIGVSTGHPAVTAGTIGCRVKDAAGNVYALSNNHVYADENRATIGDGVIQPGTFDGGTSPADDIGALSAFEPISFAGSGNVIDAAIALSSPDDLGNATPSDGYGTPSSSPVEARIRLAVMKYGRTTGQTKGKIYALNATVDVGYETGVARFVNQIIIQPGTFSAGGDSGSLVVSADRKSKGQPVGLLFAGSATVTIANPIDAVLDRFGVTIDGN